MICPWPVRSPGSDRPPRFCRRYTRPKRSNAGTPPGLPPAAKRTRIRQVFAIPRLAAYISLAYMRDPDGNRLCALYRPRYIAPGNNLDIACPLEAAAMTGFRRKGTES